MLKMILVSLFVGIVILVECLAAYTLIPSQSQVEAWAEAKAKSAAETAHAAHEEGHGEESHGEEHGGGHGKAHGDKGSHEVEVDLGKFNIVVHQPSANLTLRVNFHLIGLVTEKDHHDFESLYTTNQHRLRDQVLSEVRNSEISDLTDPGLGLIKRKILAKSNDLLGKPILKTVVFSDFAFIEQ
jgi:flagellar basal body-associated protein FliL